MQHKGNGQWGSPQDPSSSFHLPVCYCFPNSHIVVALCQHSKNRKMLLHYINYLYFLFSLIAVTFISQSILVFSVKQEGYHLHTLYVNVAHALCVSYPWHIVLHSVIVLHVSEFRTLSYCSNSLFLRSIPRPVPVPSWSLSVAITYCIWCSQAMEHHFSVHLFNKTSVFTSLRKVKAG